MTANRPDPRGKVAPIVAAARRLFLERGYGGTSMDAVASAAPVSKRTLYQHFDSKAALFGAVISRVWSGLGETPDIVADTESPEAVLRKYAERLFTHWDNPDVIALLRLVIGETARFPELSEAYFAYGKAPAIAVLTRYFDELTRKGIIAELEPERRAVQFLGMLKEPLFWPRVLGVPVTQNHDDLIGRAIEFALKR